MKNKERISQFFNGEYEVKAFANPLYHTIKRALSASYSLQDGDEHLKLIYNSCTHFLSNMSKVELPNYRMKQSSTSER